MTSTADVAGGARRDGQQGAVDRLFGAYPFGVIGPILCFYFLTRRVKPDFPPKPAQFHMAEITIEQLPAGGRCIGRCHQVAARGRAGLRRPAAASQPASRRGHRLSTSATRC